MTPGLGWRSRQRCYRAEGLSSIPSTQRKGTLGVQTYTPAPEDGEEKIPGAHRYVNVLCTHMWVCGFPTSDFRDLSVRFKKQVNCGNGRNSFQYLLFQKVNFQQWHRNQPEKRASFPRRENECYPDNKSLKQMARRGNTLVQCLRKGKRVWQKSSVLTSWPAPSLSTSIYPRPISSSEVPGIKV